MKNLLLIFSATLAAILTLSCSGGNSANQLAGSGTITGNANIMGSVTNGGDAVSGVVVYAVPETFIETPDNSSEILAFICDTTDSLGNFELAVSVNSNFSLQADLKESGVGYILQGNSLGLDSILKVECVLKEYGALEVIMPDSVDTVGMFFTIPGTILLRKPLFFKSDSGKISATVSSILTDKFEGLFIGSEKDSVAKATIPFEVLPLQTTKLEAFTSSFLYTSSNSPLPSDGVYSLAVDEFNRVWMGTSSGIIAISDRDMWYGVDLNCFGITAVPKCVKVESDSSFWVGTSFGGTLYFTGDYYYHFNRYNSSIGSDCIGDIEIDKDGAVWFATIDSGVSKFNFDKNEWSWYTTNNSTIKSNQIMDIAIDNNGAVWCATSGGVSVFNGGEWGTFTTQNSPLKSDSAVTVEIAVDNSTWVTTKDGSLFNIQKDGNFIPFEKDVWGVGAGWGTAIYCDRQGERVWVGSSLGEINCFYRGKWTNYSTDQTNLPANSGRILSIVEDLNNDIWVGTEFGGVVRFFYE